MEGERREQEETVTASRPAEQAKDVRENAIEGREGRVRERGTASVYRLQRLFAVVAPFSLSDCVSTRRHASSLLPFLSISLTETCTGI